MDTVELCSWYVCVRGARPRLLLGAVDEEADAAVAAPAGDTEARERKL